VLRSRPVLEHSVDVTVDQPGIGVTHWQEVETLASSTPADRHVVVQRDAQGTATVVFGDGANGMAPPAGTAVSPVVIRASYRVGGGTGGNVPAHTQFSSSLAAVVSAENPVAAGGGTGAEDVERARFFAPRLFRAQERAVTIDDYVDLALQAPGVGKAAATALNWNEIVLYVAPSGQVAEPSELLKRDLLAFFETRRLAGSVLVVLGPGPVDVYLRATVQAKPYFLQADVRTAVETAIADLLGFDAVAFGEPVYLSRVYDAIQSLEQVASLAITEFARVPGGGVDPTGVLTLAPHELARPGYRDNPPPPGDPLAPPQPATIVADVRGGVPA
jgi:predicted phage baseplate assembly protein